VRAPGSVLGQVCRLSRILCERFSLQDTGYVLPRRPLSGNSCIYAGDGEPANGMANQYADWSLFTRGRDRSGPLA
jgi:hypothetical protein